MLKVAILLTSPNDLRLGEALRLAHLLRNDAGTSPLYIVLGVPENSAAQRCCRGIEPIWDEERSFRWSEIGAIDYYKMFGDYVEDCIMVRPLDNGLDFRDCDFWLVVGGFPDKTLAPLVPYGISICDHVSLLRRADLERVDGILRTIRNAHVCLFPSDYFITHWQALALADRPRQLVGVLPEMMSVSKESYNFLTSERYMIYFPTSDQNLILPDLPALLNTFPPDAAIMVSLGGAKKKETAELKWTDNHRIPIEWEQLDQIIAKSELVLTGPIIDPLDTRLSGARQHKKTILMLWDRLWPPPPGGLGNETLVVEDENLIKLHQAILRLIDRKGDLNSRCDDVTTDYPIPDALDSAALISLMVEAKKK